MEAFLFLFSILLQLQCFNPLLTGLKLKKTPKKDSTKHPYHVHRKRKKKKREANQNIIMALILTTHYKTGIRTFKNSIVGYVLPLVCLLLIGIEIKSEYSGRFKAFFRVNKKVTMVT